MQEVSKPPSPYTHLGETQTANTNTSSVHDTFSRKDANGDKHIERDAPWHFTVEFQTQNGTYRNAHVYTQMQDRKDPLTGVVGLVAVGIATVGGRVKKNPEVFDEQNFSSHKKQVTSRSTINYSLSSFIFRW